jgi:small subunit ribosomal protein S3Ae
LAVKKTKTKSWFTLVSPEIFGAMEIGKTMVSDPTFLKGRTVSISAVELTNNFGKYYLKFKLHVDNVENEKAFTTFAGSECMRDYISRMILRYIRRIDAVQDLQTKDGVKIRVKSLAVVSKKAKSSVVKSIRGRIQEIVKDIVEKSTLGDFVAGIVDDRAKARVLDEIRLIYPVRNFEFRKTEVLK